MTKITINRSVVEQALEALEEFCEHQTMLRPIEKRESLKAALAEPVQEPVAQAMQDAVVYGMGIFHGGKRIDPDSIYEKAEPVQDGKCKHCVDGCPACDARKLPVQEPVAWRFEARHIDSAWAAAVTLKHPGPEGVYMRNVMPLYAHPPQRPAEPVQEPVATMTVREDMGADFKFNRPHTLLPGQQFHLHLAPLRRKEGS